MGVCEFTVTINKKEVVTAVLPLQNHYLPLSNLDLLLPPIDVSVFFCYKKPNDFTFTSMLRILKKSMAQTLVSYYVFAGEVVTNSIGEPQLLCNNRGVDFIQAYAHVDLKDLHLYNPDSSLQGKLVPTKKDGVLCIQVTELQCGGLVVACTFDHRIADAYSTNMFLVAWAEFARARPVSLQPSFQRSLLKPRFPGYYDATLDNMYMPVSTLLPPATPTHPEPESDRCCISRIYYITADNINRLQSEASSNGRKRSKLESFSAFLWKIVGKGAGYKTNRCKMGIVVDGRTRIIREGSSLGNYFGNVVSIPYGDLSSLELKTKPLSWVAEAVHECLKPAVTEEHFLGLIDWVESHRPEPAVARIYGTQSKDEVSLVVSSGQRFPVLKVDFGWGTPAFGSYHFPWPGEAGYVMPMPSASGNGDWVVYMHLLEEHLDLLEAEFAHVFRPFTSQHLNLGD